MPIDRERARAVAADASIELTARERTSIAEAATLLPAGTRVNVTFLATERTAERIETAAQVVAAGLIPVPHLAARRLASHDEAAAFLAGLADVGAATEVLVVAGDPSEPLGPFPDALSLISSGLLEAHGVRAASVSGYPEGHPDIDDRTLWAALEDKVATLRSLQIEPTIITQFGFDAAAVVDWIEAVRARDIDATIRVGVPGPAGVARLLRFARRFGIAASASKAASYGLSLTRLAGTAGPERFVAALGDLLTEAHGDVRLHLYPFGDVAASSRWLHDALSTPAGRA